MPIDTDRAREDTRWNWAKVADQTQTIQLTRDDITALETRLRQFQQAGDYPTQFERPLGAQLELTSACNLRCVHCFNNSGKRGNRDRMSPASWISVVKQLVSLEIFACVISGGEPLLLGDQLFQLLDLLNDGGVFLHLISNGWLLGETEVERLAKYKYYCIQISIDGARPQTHDFIRGRRGSWMRAVNAALLVNKFRIPLTVAHAIVRQNVDELDKMIDFAYQLGARRIIVSIYSPVGRAFLNDIQLSLVPEQQESVDQILQTKQRQYGGSMEVVRGPDDWISIRLSSVEPTSVLLIRPDGKVKIDCVAPFVIGDALTESLRDIWERIGMQAWQHPQAQLYARQLEVVRDIRRLKPVAYVDEEIQLSSERNVPVVEESKVARTSSRGKQSSSNITPLNEKVFSNLLDRRPKKLPAKTRRDGRFLLALPLSTGQLCVMNNTSAEIYERCDGSTTIRQLIEYMQSTYPTIRRNVLFNDILVNLRDLEAKSFLRL